MLLALAALATAPGKTSYYYVRGEQEDGELVWVSPMWNYVYGEIEHHKSRQQREGRELGMAGFGLV